MEGLRVQGVVDDFPGCGERLTPAASGDEHPEGQEAARFPPRVVGEGVECELVQVRDVALLDEPGQLGAEVREAGCDGVPDDPRAQGELEAAQGVLLSGVRCASGRVVAENPEDKPGGRRPRPVSS